MRDGCQRTANGKRAAPLAVRWQVIDPWASRHHRVGPVGTGRDVVARRPAENASSVPRPGRSRLVPDAAPRADPQAFEAMPTEATVLPEATGHAAKSGGRGFGGRHGVTGDFRRGSVAAPGPTVESEGRWLPPAARQEAGSGQWPRSRMPLRSSSATDASPSRVSHAPKGRGSNVVYERLRERGDEVFAVTPATPAWQPIPSGMEAVVIGTRARRADRPGVHRSRHQASVSQAATVLGRQHSLTAIDGGCP